MFLAIKRVVHEYVFKEMMLLIVFRGGKPTIDFQLDVKEKSKLIEILLIVGTLLAALQLPINLIWIFMLFVCQADGRMLDQSAVSRSRNMTCKNVLNQNKIIIASKQYNAKQNQIVFSYEEFIVCHAFNNPQD